MVIKFQYEDGATPLDENEINGLIPGHLTLQRELNDWEALNIIKGKQWGEKSKFKILSEQFINRLHKEMFGETWKWAGNYRTSNKNIGVDYRTIPTELRNLLDDTRYWLEHQIFDERQVALRLHHRLVKIHLYANGNGRHARLVADLFLIKKSFEPFSWKQEKRSEYIAALRLADNGDYGDLEKLLL